MKAPLITRLLSRRTINEDGCWVFDGCRHRLGYGLIGYGSSTKKTHRVSMMLFRGFDINSKDMVLHTCDNRACFNPDHLYVGNQSLNMKDASRRKRFPDRRGLANQNAKKLTPETVKQIRSLLAEGQLSQSQIGLAFDVPQTAISKIKLGKLWSHV